MQIFSSFLEPELRQMITNRFYFFYFFYQSPAGLERESVC